MAGFLDRADKIVAVAGGIIGIVGGLAGGWVYYVTELADPPTFEVIGSRFVDEQGRDVQSRVGSYWSEDVEVDTMIQFELAFRYYNASDSYVHPIQLDPILPLEADGYFSENQRDELLDKLADRSTSCHLERIESAVAPGESKDLLCRTQPLAASVLSYGRINERGSPDITHALYDYWFNTCAVAINLTTTNDADLPFSYDFVLPENIVGLTCGDNEGQL